MREMISKSGFVVLTCVIAGMMLAGCGRKPGLSNLKAPEPKFEAAPATTPRKAPTLDGKTVEPEPVTNARPKRGFPLDFLL